MKFNTKVAGTNTTTNFEGEKAYKLTPQLELYSAVVTASLSDKFYENTKDRLTRIRSLIKQNSPEFVAKLAVYTREKMYLRSIPLVLTAELTREHQGDNLISRLTARVIQRADEITELLAYYKFAKKSQDKNDRKKLNSISVQLRKGLAKAFNKFNEYQFAKYNRDTEIKLRDALFLVHPTPEGSITEKVQKQALFDKIAQGTLETPYTWEVELTKTGQVQYETEEAKVKAFQAKWEELIDSGKLGYMALLRNLRNILEAKVSKGHITEVITRLTNPVEVANSKQLPFRFLSAYRELESISSVYTTSLLEALEEAARLSLSNIKGFDLDSRVLIACDVSGSMSSTISEKSKMHMYDVGIMLGSLAQSQLKFSIFGVFGDSWKVVNKTSKSILGEINHLYERAGVGHSTNGHLVIQHLLNNDIEIDKVFVFTDCQVWDSSGYYHRTGSMKTLWTQYHKKYPNAKLYLFDLAGYGNTPIEIQPGGAALIAGWSDKVFDVLAALEGGQSALAEINQIEL